VLLTVVGLAVDAAEGKNCRTKLESQMLRRTIKQLEQ